MDTFYEQLQQFKRGYSIVKDDPTKVVNGMLVIPDDDQLKRWKEHFSTILDHMASNEIPGPVDQPHDMLQKERRWILVQSVHRLYVHRKQNIRIS